MRMVADPETGTIIEAIPFKCFKEKIRLVKSLIKIGKVEIDTESNIIIVIHKEG